MPLPSALGGIKEIRINWKSILHDDFSLLDDNHLLSKQQTFGVKVYKKVKAYIIIMLTFFFKKIIRQQTSRCKFLCLQNNL